MNNSIFKGNNFPKYSFLLLVFSFGLLIPLEHTFNSSSVSAENFTTTNTNKTKIVYHLSSDNPWRATVALSDSHTMLKMGYNVSLMLSIEGVQVGVKNPHYPLGLDMLTKNVTNFIHKGGHVIICEICLHIAGYNNSDIIDGAVIGSPKLMANLLNQTTVVDY